MRTSTLVILLFNHLEIASFHLVLEKYEHSPLRDSGSEPVKEVVSDKN